MSIDITAGRIVPSQNIEFSKDYCYTSVELDGEGQNLSYFGKALKNCTLVKNGLCIDVGATLKKFEKDGFIQTKGFINYHKDDLPSYLTFKKKVKVFNKNTRKWQICTDYITNNDFVLRESYIAYYSIESIKTCSLKCFTDTWIMDFGANLSKKIALKVKENLHYPNDNSLHDSFKTFLDFLENFEEGRDIIYKS